MTAVHCDQSTGQVTPFDPIVCDPVGSSDTKRELHAVSTLGGGTLQ